MRRLTGMLARSRADRVRGDAGVAAVLFALTSVVIFGLAAMCIDLGHEFVMHQQVQKDSDFAALAGGAGSDLPAPVPSTNRTCSYGIPAQASDQAVIDVAAHLTTSFRTDGDGAMTVTPAQLVDCDLTNGEAVYGTLSGSGTSTTLAYNRNQLTVVSPGRKVPFNFAPAVGLSNSGTVAARSTVQIGSPTIRSLPLYTYTTCDYGDQTIAQPTNGHAALIVMLAYPNDTNAATFNAAGSNPEPLVTNPATTTATTTATVPLDVQSPYDSLVINGTHFTNVTDIGFFESGDGVAGPAPVDLPITDSTVTAHSDTSISISHLPTAVTTVRDTWYVRLKIGGSWSQAVTSNNTLVAAPLQVGTQTLLCGQGSNEGNFGTLDLHNSAGPSGNADNIAYNIATNVQHPLALFPSPQSPWTCDQSTVGAVLWSNDGTNCVAVQTGLDLNAATEGFLTGVAGKPGRLTDISSGTGCASNGMPATRVINNVSINNDTLSCFFTDDTTNIGDITSSTYSGGPVLSSAIYNSPRFALVPVLGAQPGNGNSNKYEIVDMRAAFITDQVASATRSTPATATNGVQMSSNGNSLASLQVVFFNANALPPPPPDSGYTAYEGYGLKVLRLVN